MSKLFSVSQAAQSFRSMTHLWIPLQFVTSWFAMNKAQVTQLKDTQQLVIVLAFVWQPVDLVQQTL
jgi:hypothetical protein